MMLRNRPVDEQTVSVGRSSSGTDRSGAVAFRGQRAGRSQARIVRRRMLSGKPISASGVVKSGHSTEATNGQTVALATYDERKRYFQQVVEEALA